MTAEEIKVENGISFLPTGEQMGALDRHTIEELHIPSLVLMERAALAVFDTISRLGKKAKSAGRKVLIVCGSGNNGADGLALARMCVQAQYDVTVWTAGDHARQSEQYQTQLHILHSVIQEYSLSSARKAVICTKEPEDDQHGEDDVYNIVVDALFGVGLSRPLSERHKKLIRRLNRMSGVRVAVDIPSGVHSVTGTILGEAFHADETVTFECVKRGMILYPGAKYCGEITRASIGISTEILKNDKKTAWTSTVDHMGSLLPKREADSNKGTNGKALLIAGCEQMSGAAYLAALGAYSTGVGYVKIYTHRLNRDILQGKIPEALVSVYDDEADGETAKNPEHLFGWCDAVCIGSGLGTSERAEQLVLYTLRNCGKPVVLDGDALNITARHLNLQDGGEPDDDWSRYFCDRDRPVILTPHVREMSRLAGCCDDEIKRDPVEAAQKFADRFPGVVVVLKDARTVVCQTEKRPFIHYGGTSAMAKAGSGDVLAGICLSLAAQKCSAYETAVLSVCLHGAGGVCAQKKSGQFAVMASMTAVEAGKVMDGLWRNEKTMSLQNDPVKNIL